MKRWIISGVVVVAVILVGFAMLFSWLWYPGITQRQTAWILVEDDKFGGRAHWKAKLHGDSIIDELAGVTNDIEILSYQGARNIGYLLDDLEATPRLLEYGQRFYRRPHLYPKLLGALILSKLDEEKTSHPELFDFLQSVSMRRYAGLEQNLFRVRDYYSGLAILAVGNLGGDGSFELLAAILHESPVPIQRHRVVCRALVTLGDPRAIKVLRERMLDEDFHATVAAYQALVALGDETAEQVVEKRLEIEPDNSLLKKILDER